jgi:hypothetical protein
MALGQASGGRHESPLCAPPDAARKQRERPEHKWAAHLLFYADGRSHRAWPTLNWPVLAGRLASALYKRGPAEIVSIELAGAPIEPLGDAQVATINSFIRSGSPDRRVRRRRTPMTR